MVVEFFLYISLFFYYKRSTVVDSYMWTIRYKIEWTGVRNDNHQNKSIWYQMIYIALLQAQKIERTYRRTIKKSWTHRNQLEQPNTNTLNCLKQADKTCLYKQWRIKDKYSILLLKYQEKLEKSIRYTKDEVLNRHSAVIKDPSKGGP